MDEDKTQEAISKGRHAAALLEDETLTEAFNNLKNSLVERVFATTDQRERDRCIDLVKALGHLRAALGTMVANGSVSQKQLEDMTTGKLKQRFGIV